MALLTVPAALLATCFKLCTVPEPCMRWLAEHKCIHPPTSDVAFRWFLSCRPLLPTMPTSFSPPMCRLAASNGTNTTRPFGTYVGPPACADGYIPRYQHYQACFGTRAFSSRAQCSYLSSWRRSPAVCAYWRARLAHLGRLSWVVTQTSTFGCFIDRTGTTILRQPERSTE